MLESRPRRLAAIAAGAVLLAAPLAGCGSSDEKSGDAKAGSSASSTTSPSPADETSSSASSTPSSGSSAPADPDAREAQAFLARVTKAMREGKTAHLVLAIGSSMTADADVAYRGDKTAMRMTMSAGNQNVQVILLDGAMYLQQAAGGKYVKIDKSDPAMGALLDQFNSFTPQESLNQVKGGVTKVTKVGTEKIDGKNFDKYALTVDTKAISGGLGTAASQANLPKTVTYAMYVDGDDLLRRVSMDVAGQKVVMNVTDWGKSIKIEAPPASQVQKR